MEELFVSIDIEASGPIPGIYSMLSIGATVVRDTSKKFYVELKPLNKNFVDKALQVANFNLEWLEEHGRDPAAAMLEFEKWIKEISVGRRPVFVGFNAPFDWMFVCYYFHAFLGRNPFGTNALDQKAYYMGMMNTSWGDTIKRKIRKYFRPKQKHTHHALDDAVEQAEIFEQMLDYQKRA